MIGRTLGEQMKKEEISIGETLLKVEDLAIPGKFEDISIEIRKGEIVGMGGLIGSGRTEVASAIFGLTPPKSGKIFIKGKEEKINNPMEAISKGIAMVPEDRSAGGLFMTFTVEHNMTFASLDKISKWTWLNFKKEDLLVESYIKNLSIMLRDANQEVRELSGGNQQKVVLSKWLMTQPEIILLDEPTRGIDVGAKAEVYKLINNLAKEGKAILLISSEMEEIIQLSDRVYVMSEGRIAASLGREELSEETIMTAAAVTKKREGKVLEK
jgi:ABC-type sugar transport system ATPase subunit